MCCFMRRSKIKKKSLRGEKIPTKPTKDNPSAKCNSVDRTLPIHRFSKNDNRISFGKTSAAPSNNYSSSIVVNDTVEPLMACSSIPLRKTHTSDEARLFDIPCGAKIETNFSVVNQNKSSTAPTPMMSYGNDNLVFGDTSRQEKMLVHKREEPQQRELVQIPSTLYQEIVFEEEQMMIDRLESLTKPETLGEDNFNGSRTIPNQLHSGSSHNGVPLTDDIDLDLDTIFDDNVNDFNNSHSCAYNHSSSTKNRMYPSCPSNFNLFRGRARER